MWQCSDLGLWAFSKRLPRPIFPRWEHLPNYKHSYSSWAEEEQGLSCLAQPQGSALPRTPRTGGAALLGFAAQTFTNQKHLQVFSSYSENTTESHQELHNTRNPWWKWNGHEDLNKRCVCIPCARSCRGQLHTARTLGEDGQCPWTFHKHATNVAFE